MWVEIIGSAAAILMMVIMFYVKKLVNYLIKRMDANEEQKQAFDLLLEGMAKAQENFVRQAKEAAKDGKLSKEEIEIAKGMALEHAKKIAMGPVKDIIVSWSKEKVASYIKQLLVKYKS